MHIGAGTFWNDILLDTDGVVLHVEDTTVGQSCGNAGGGKNRMTVKKTERKLDSGERKSRSPLHSKEGRKEESFGGDEKNKKGRLSKKGFPAREGPEE